MKNVFDLPIQTYNNANQTKWIFQFPVGQLFNLKLGNNKSRKFIRLSIKLQVNYIS
jgi:hypothetical protein